MTRMTTTNQKTDGAGIVGIDGKSHAEITADVFNNAFEPGTSILKEPAPFCRVSSAPLHVFGEITVEIDGSASLLESILAKPGNEWTNEETKEVAKAIKLRGRQSLKSQRRDIQAQAQAEAQRKAEEVREKPMTGDKLRD